MTKTTKDLTESEFAHQTGFMTGMAAIRDAAGSKERITMKEAAEMIGYGIKFDQKAFMAGLAEALVIALLEKSDYDADLKFLAHISS